jgi:hypothetical protein
MKSKYQEKRKIKKEMEGKLIEDIKEETKTEVKRQIKCVKKIKFVRNEVTGRYEKVKDENQDPII